MNSYLQGLVHVITGDITTREVDALVNAANSSLLGGGGVDGAIHRAGGPAILEACRELRASTLRQGLPPGEAVITTGGRLKARYVIHTVGPVWHGGGQGEEETLRRAYRSCLDLAEGRGLASLAFPAISTGVYGFPKDLAAEVVTSVLTAYAGRSAADRVLRRIELVYFSAADAALFEKTARARFPKD